MGRAAYFFAGYREQAEQFASTAKLKSRIRNQAYSVRDNWSLYCLLAQLFSSNFFSDSEQNGAIKSVLSEDDRRSRLKRLRKNGKVLAMIGSSRYLNL